MGFEHSINFNYGTGCFDPWMFFSCNTKVIKGNSLKRGGCVSECHKLVGNCIMWSDASNYKRASNYEQGDDVWNKLRSAWMGLRRGGMWGEVDRRRRDLHTKLLRNQAMKFRGAELIIVFQHLVYSWYSAISSMRQSCSPPPLVHWKIHRVTVRCVVDMASFFSSFTMDAAVSP